MRNLKRALSLTLASVMLLGMMVVGSSAAAGYDDVKETDNVEAIEVLQAVEVMVGDDRGFGPDRPVNRAEMAVVMGKLLNLDYNYYASTCPFTDVSGNYDWARGWVGACAANGIVSGRGNGIYDPAATVTAVEAASMMMRALGYFQHTEDYADGFVTATVRQGSEIGIFNGVGTDGTTPMTRNQVAQMALNALESEMVTFTGTPGVSVNGVNVGYRAEYTPRTSTELKYRAIEDRTSDASDDSNHRGQYYIQLGEQLYDGKLTKKFDRDIFERPSINWQYDGKEIGVYVDNDLKVAEYTSAVKYNTLYDELTYTTIKDNDVLRYVDGKEITPFSKDNFARSNKSDLPSSGTGVLTEVFVDLSRDEITITSINTYLAKANNDYNATNETLSLKVYDNATGTTKIVDSDEVPEAEGVKKDEYRLVYMSAKENPSYEVVDMFDVEIMLDSEVTKWSKDSTKVVDKLTTGGTEYSANVKAFYDKANDVFEDYDYQLLSDMSYNIFLDRYGNVIGVDEAEGTRNYVFVTGYDRGKSHIATKTADANAIFLDGTMDVITVNVTDTNKNIENTKLNMGTYDKWNVQDGKVNENRWYTYTVGANGNYTLKPVARSIYTAYELGATEVKTLNTANLYLDDSHVGTKYNSTSAYEKQGRIYGNDDSVYITVEAGRVDLSCSNEKHDINGLAKPTADDVKDAITDVAGVYTGAQNVKLDLSLETKQEINQDGIKYDAAGEPVNGVCKTGHDEHGDTNNKTTNERNAYVYSIYDSNYYVIASVVLGEAQGGSANYVYVLDGAKNERVEHSGDSRTANGDTYYWEFEAVVNGEITTLTVKEKYADTLKSTLKVHTMQEIRFDGEYVTAIKDVPANKLFINYQGADTAKVPEKVKTDDMDVYDVGYVYNNSEWSAVGDYMDGDGVPYYASASTKMAEMRDIFDASGWTAAQRAGRIDGTIQLVGRTLYTDRANGDVGLALNTDAKAVLIQPENGEREATNCGSVAEAIGRLADKDIDRDGIQFQGRIAAVLDSNGAAKWVVIISDTNLRTGNNPDYGYNGRTYYLDLSGELFSGYSNSTSVWSSAENNNRGGYVEGYNLNSSTSGWGNTTRYEVRSGSTVVVRNNNTDAQMNWYFNNVYMDDIMRFNGRDGYEFIMPSENVAIEGRHNMRYTANIAGFTGENITAGTNVTFNGEKTGVDLGAGVNTVRVNITMPGRSVSSLESGKYYTVTIGEYQDKVDVLCVGKTLSFDYKVTTRDLNAKRIMVWDINLAKDQKPVEPDVFEISVEKVGEGTVNVPSSAAVGTTVTVEAVAAGGYKLDTITVNGKPIAGDTFEMPAENVKVVVTFKVDDPNAPVSVTIVPGKGTAPVDLFREGQAVSANDIRVDDKISLDPAEVLEFTNGVDTKPDENGWYTVTGDITIDLKDGWRFMLGWYWDNQGNMYTPAAAAMAAYARVSAPEWVAGVVQGKIYNVKATLADGTEIVWTLRKNDETGKIQLLPPEGITDEQLAASEEAFAGVLDDDYVIEENGGSGDVTPADDRCQAVINEDDSIEIKVYKGFEPTEGQIKAAIAKATGKDLTSKDVVIDGTDVTIGKETGFTLVEEQTEMFKVEIDDKAAGKTVTIYAASEETIHVPETVKGLLPTDAIVGTSSGGTTNVALAVTSSTVELPELTEDVKYVSALALWISAAGSEELYYANGEATGYTKITPAANTYVQAKAPLMVRLTGTAGAKAGVTINGVDYTGTVDAQGNLEIAVNDLVSYAEGQSALTIAAYTAKKAYTVKIDGKTITNPATEDGKWFEDDVITLTTPVTGTLIAGKHITSSGAKAETLPGSDYKKIQVTNTLATAGDAADGVIDLNTAYTLAGYQFATNAFELSGVDEEGNELTLAAGDLIAKDYELKLTANAAGKTAKVKTGSKYTLGTPTWDEDGNAVYTIKVTSDIAADEFVADMVVTVPTDALELKAVPAGSEKTKEYADKAAVDGSVEIAVTNGLTKDTKVEHEWSSKGGESELKKLTIKHTIDVTNKKVVFSFVNNSGETATLDATGSQETNAKMVVTIGDVTLTVGVVVKQAS